MKKFCYLHLLLLLLLLSCRTNNQETVSQQAQPSQAQWSFQRGKYNILLITLDTVRAEALELYNPQGASVPNLKEFAKRGVLFTQAAAQIPFTLASHTTMFTGLYPISHGVLENVRSGVPAGIPTLAEQLRKNGYETAGFVGAMVLAGSTGISRGFDTYDDCFSIPEPKGAGYKEVERPADDVAAAFHQWFEKRDASKNFFAFVHFYDAHSPYEPPDAYYPSNPTPVNRYRGEIQYVDSVLGKLLHSLDTEKHAFQNTVILIEADHGEMLSEHGEMGHGYFLYEPVLRVPLILYVPSLKMSKQGPPEIAQHVELIDIPSTLLDVVGLQIPPTFQGESLLPLLEGKPRKNQLQYSEAYGPALMLGISPLFSVRDGRYVYIHAPRPELYDLAADPDETANLADVQGTRAAEMRDKIRRYQQSYAGGRREERPVSSEEIEKMESLGYIGSSLPKEKWDYRKDPKDFISDWMALEGMKTADPSGTLAALEEIRKKLPSTADVFRLKAAQCYTLLGRYQEAENLLKAIQSPEAWLPLALIYRDTGRKDQAVQYYREKAGSHPSLQDLRSLVLLLVSAGRNAEASALLQDVEDSQKQSLETKSFLTEMNIALNRWDKVERYSREMLQQRPWELHWCLLTSEALEKQNQVQKAGTFLSGQESAFAGQPLYWMQLGSLLEKTAQPSKAAEAFRHMTQLSPRDPRGYLRLANLKVMFEQKPDDALQLVRQAMLLRLNRDEQIYAHFVLMNAFSRKGNSAEAEREKQILKSLQQPRPAP